MVQRPIEVILLVYRRRQERLVAAVEGVGFTSNQKRGLRQGGRERGRGEGSSTLVLVSFQACDSPGYSCTNSSTHPRPRLLCSPAEFLGRTRPAGTQKGRTSRAGALLRGPCSVN